MKGPLELRGNKNYLFTGGGCVGGSGAAAAAGGSSPSQQSPGGTCVPGLIQPCLISGVCIRKNSAGVSIDDFRFGGSEEMELEESDSSEVQAMNQVRNTIGSNWNLK